MAGRCYWAGHAVTCRRHLTALEIMIGRVIEYVHSIHVVTSIITAHAPIWSSDTFIHSSIHMISVGENK